MSKTLFIILSVIVVVVLLTAWIYLLFFSDRQVETPSLSDVFANLESESSNISQPDLQIVSEEDFGTQGSSTDATLPTPPSDLRQLTTRNVAGYEEIQVSSSSVPQVYIMESGIGHIYSIDLETGEETRISATTIPDAREAVFSSDGKHIAVKVGSERGVNDLYIGTINRLETSVNHELLTPDVKEVRFIDEETLLLTTQTNSSVAIQTYSTDTNELQTLATIPFREASVLLGASATGPHYFYPKTAIDLEGFLYRYQAGTLTRLPYDGFSFAATAYGDSLLLTSRQGTELTSTLIGPGEEKPLVSSLLPQKCVFFATTSLICGKEGGEVYSYNALDSWMKGTRSYNDSLHIFTPNTYVTVDVMAASGRMIDLYQPAIGSYSGDFYFMNKLDSTLWWYNLADATETEIE